MMKRIFVITFISVLCVASLKSQEKQDSKFIVMNGYGYTFAEFVGGFANVNSFIYKFHNRWGAGLDLGVTSGNRINDSGLFFDNKQMLETKINSLSIGPNIYYFIVNRSKHIAYINGGVNYTRKNVTRLSSEIIQNEPNESWSSKNDNVFGFNISAGYSYKLTDTWGIGARVYCNHIEELYTMGLLNATVSF